MNNKMWNVQNPTRPLIKKSGGRGKAVRAWAVICPHPEHAGTMNSIEGIGFDKKDAWDEARIMRESVGEVKADLTKAGYRCVPVLITEVVSVPRASQRSVAQKEKRGAK